MLTLQLLDEFVVIYAFIGFVQGEFLTAGGNHRFDFCKALLYQFLQFFYNVVALLQLAVQFIDLFDLPFQHTTCLISFVIDVTFE